MSDEKPTTKPEHFGFLQVLNYSMIAFSSAIEPLRMANRNSGRELYRWSLYTIDGLPEKASNGLEITPDASLEHANDIDTLFICGGADIGEAWSRQLHFTLRRIAKQSVPLLRKPSRHKIPPAHSQLGTRHRTEDRSRRQGRERFHSGKQQEK